MNRLTIRNSDGSVSQPTNTTIKSVFERLAEYEDAEEQGRLIKLPCAVGDTVWCTERYGGKPIAVYSDVIQTIGISRNNIKVQTRDHKGYGKFHVLGKTAFLTPEQAEAALKKGV